MRLESSCGMRRDENWKSTRVLRRVIILPAEICVGMGCGAANKKSNSYIRSTHSLIITDFARTRNVGGASTAQVAVPAENPLGDGTAPKSRRCSPTSGATKRSSCSRTTDVRPTGGTGEARIAPASALSLHSRGATASFLYYKFTAVPGGAAFSISRFFLGLSFGAVSERRLRLDIDETKKKRLGMRSRRPNWSVDIINPCTPRNPVIAIAAYDDR